MSTTKLNPSADPKAIAAWRRTGYSRHLTAAEMAGQLTALAEDLLKLGDTYPLASLNVSFLAADDDTDAVDMLGEALGLGVGQTYPAGDSRHHSTDGLVPVKAFAKVNAPADEAVAA